MRALLHVFPLVLWLLASASAQTAHSSIEIRDVSVGFGSDKVTIDVNLTSSVVPEVITATHPDRLVLQLANTAAPRKQQGVAVNRNGVKGVRIGLHRVTPPTARVVVDLNAAHPYSIAMNGSKITLTILPAPKTLNPGRFRGASNSSGCLMASLPDYSPFPILLP